MKNRNGLYGAALSVAIVLTAAFSWAIDIDAEQNKRIQDLENRMGKISGGNGSSKTDATNKELLKKVDELSKKVEELKAKQTSSSMVLNTTYGSLTMKGIMQAQYDRGENGTPVSQFKLARMRLLFFGDTPVKKIGYFIQADLANYADSKVLLDAKMMFKYIPMTTVNVGRFVPSFSYYMPRSVADLDLISYPLVIQKYAVWRANGIQTDFKSKYVSLNGGVFNGYPANGTSDDNSEKDYLGRVDITPIKDMAVFGYAWLGREKVGSTTEFGKDRCGGGLSWRYRIFNVVGEYIKARDERYSKTNNTAGQFGRRSEGWYSNLGVKVLPWLEVLGRYDRFDPNINVKNNSEQWTTMGLNFLQDGNHIKYSVNYIFKSEQSNKIDNDEFLAQAQIFF